MTKQSQHVELVWIKPQEEHEFSVPIGCQVKRSERNKTLVRDDDGKEFWIPEKDIIKRMHITSQQDVHDMITLGDLQEYAILRNLHVRYNRKQIYTYTGAMLVAINPYEVLPIYTNREIGLYRNKKIGELPPHIFAIGDNAFQELRRDAMNQCIVISGESGAGKTESTKLILQYLAAISGKHSWIEQQVIEANPVMEAFGNAKTIRNDNSSRFGKYIEIHFDDNNAIKGAKIEHYLLEKSRIVSQNKDERNYHIFYSMLAGLSREEKRKLELEDASKYYYLSQGGSLVCEGRDDAADFTEIRSAMQVLSFSSEETWNIFSLLAALLHFGNLKIKGVVVQNMDSCEVHDNTNATKIAMLLGIQKQALCDALSRKTIFAHGERVVTAISKDTAIEGRDAFVRAIYGRIFLRIVNRINETIFKIVPTENVRTIGVLDIFGFENFLVNSFEQLCINYANENLQQFFVQHIFKMEQEEYASENIDWKIIDFVDNQQILDIIGMKSVNIMSLIDEESKFPKGTDFTLLDKLHSTHGKRTIYLKPKSSQTSHFGIQHYAGVVYYNPNGFLEKNRDSFSLDLKEMVARSTNSYLVDLFSPEGLRDTGKKSVTLSVQFRNSLDMLMKTLSACHPFFIRCIKPNETKQPNNFDRALCVRQLRYSGMMETTKIRQAGYPIRHIYKEFVQRYRHLVAGIASPHKINCREATEKICRTVLGQKADFQLGDTKVFLKDIDDIRLEKERERVYLKFILIIQRGFRRIIFKKWLQRHRQAAVTIQRAWRGHRSLSNYLLLRQGFLRLQACIRSRQLSFQFGIIRDCTTMLQAHCRGYLTRLRVTDKLKRLREIISLRATEEKEFRKAGKKNWKTDADSNYRARLTELSQDMQISQNYRAHRIDIEEDNKVVDAVFGFLDTTPDDTNDDARYAGYNKVLSRGGTIRIPASSKRAQIDLTEFNFPKFAVTYFQGNISPQYTKRPLKSSLLGHPIPLDEISSKSIWITILRFMGDMAEARYENDDEDEGSIRLPVMQRLTVSLSRGVVQSHEFQEALKSLEGTSEQQRLVRKTLKRKTKLPEILRKALDNSEEVEYYHQWLSIRSSNLEKLHFIIGHGILRPELRDEIFCQICKQLTNNPNHTSFAKGWILLSLCLGCFPPSEKFLPYLRSFLRTGPELYAPYCENRLDRTFKNGIRTQPPSWLELHATRNKTPISLMITLMDASEKKLQVDSASTAREAVAQLAQNIGLRDVFGFSIFITLFDKVMSLGNGREHILDAISNCEQYAKEQGMNDRKAPWKLFLRKEIFAPWYNPSEDELATHLIYRQITRGVNFGEYRCKSDKDIVILAVLQYYVDHGSNMNQQLLRQYLPSYIPKDLLAPGDRAIQKWEQLVMAAFDTHDYVRNKIPRKCAKEDIAIFGQINWPMMFSRFFEAVRISGPKLISDNVIVAVNSTGVYLVDEMEQVLAEFSYPEILSVSCRKDESSNIDELSINTIQSEDFIFKCFESKDISLLINFIVTNLKGRSIYAVATQNYSNPSNPTGYLQYTKGDLIRFEKGTTGVDLLQAGKSWARGECNGSVGEFPTETVYVLPTIMEPAEFLLKMFKEGAAKPKKYVPENYNTIQRQRMHTLKKFADDHFRTNAPAPRLSHTMQAARSRPDDLWKHSRDPIKAPLLLRLQYNNELFDKAVAISSYILKYMGDMPSGRHGISTDLIFQPALEDDAIRDEVYCQIMKQLTENKIQLSVERGWDLMWLATGIMAPTSILLKELMEFLRTRLHPIAGESLKRIKRTLKVGQRKHPPHAIEVEAIQKRIMQIYHKIYFPDDTVQAFEIESSTRAEDLCETIAKRLDLKSREGFSLFVKIADKAFSVPDEDFIFDFINELVNWVKETMPSRNTDQQINCQYQLFFMKKLWVNTIPGKDVNADLIFHFPQEVPKYLNSYYKVGKEEATRFAALLYRIQFGDNMVQLQRPLDILPRLLPEDLINVMKPDEWRKSITNALLTLGNADEEEAKHAFLQKISKYPMFGSTFFVVKQNNDPHLPGTILIAINRNGFHIIDTKTKDVFVTYPFSQLNGWSSGNAFFQIRFGNMIGATKLLCTTTQGYKIDNLLSSYIKYLKSLVLEVP